MRKLSLIGLISLLFFYACDMNMAQEHSYTNQLINETSPYLLQHAHNPVDWNPWGDKALTQAKDEDKLIIVSIGYAACHWCHVMEHESFEDSVVATKMNQNFVSIKVDREERPDIDQIYMDAAQLLTGRGGWPLNVITLPEGRPVFAGTYFPKENWKKVLDYFSDLYVREPQKLLDQAEKLTEGIAQNEIPTFNQEASNYSVQAAESIAEELLKTIDMELGGRSGAPKFPMPSIYEYLLTENYFRGNEKVNAALRVTLDKMSYGGIYDHLGGGFSRYSVDQNWTVPHFEKMLYDNAQLISLYSHAYQYYQDDNYKRIVEETIAFCKRELKDASGAFYSSLDADSEGEEGKFYVWEEAEIDQLLGEKSQVFKSYYGVSRKGNFEGKNILEIKNPKADIAKEYGLSIEDANKILVESKEKLMSARDIRIRPGLDDKILTSWNGLMIMGLVDAYFALGDSQYLEDAVETGEFLIKKQVFNKNQIFRNHKNGKANIHGFLDDYAFTILAFVKLYEGTFDEKWLLKAKELKEFVHQHFLDESTQMYFYTSDTDQKLIARKMELSDNVIPGSNSAMAQALMLLGHYFYDDQSIVQANQMIANTEGNFSKHPYFYSNWARLNLIVGESIYEIAVVGNEAHTLSSELSKSFIPHKVLLGGTTEGTLELLKGKLSNKATFIYVCQDKSCKLPVKTVDAALNQIK